MKALQLITFLVTAGGPRKAGCTTQSEPACRFGLPGRDCCNPPRSRDRAEIHRRFLSSTRALYLIVTFVSGCGGSDVQEISEASKKALIQRKVDVKAGTAKSTKSGQRSSKR